MSNRRDFIRKSLVGAGAAAVVVPGALMNEAQAAPLATPTSAPTQTPQVRELVNRNAFKRIPVSCLSYSFNALVREGMMDIFHYFETCRYRFNIDAADLWSGMITSPNDDDYINKVHRALQERDLVVPGIAADGAHLISAPGRDTPEDRARLRGIQDRYMEMCKKWGVGFLRLDAGPMPGGTGANAVTNNMTSEWAPADFDYLVRRYRELAQVAYDHGFVIGNENHMGHSKWWPNMEKLIQAVDHPGFGICVHFGGWTTQNPDTRVADNDAIDALAARWICHTHMVWELCHDVTRLTAKMNMLRNAGYKGYYNAECHAGQNEYNITEVMIGMIRSVVNNWNNGGTGELFPPRGR